MRRRHYGLRLGDGVIVSLASAKVGGEVIHLYATDNNRARVRLHDGAEYDVTAESCQIIRADAYHAIRELYELLADSGTSEITVHHTDLSAALRGLQTLGSALSDLCDDPATDRTTAAYANARAALELLP